MGGVLASSIRNNQSILDAISLESQLTFLVLIAQILCLKLIKRAKLARYSRKMASLIRVFAYVMLNFILR